MSKRLPRSTVRRILMLALLVWIILMIVGFLIGYDTADQNKLIAGGVGVLLAGGVWVVLCWSFGLVLRAQLRRRGYDLSPEAKER